MSQVLNRWSNRWGLILGTVLALVMSVVPRGAPAISVCADSFGGPTGAPFVATLGPDEYTTVTLYLPPAIVTDLNVAVRMRSDALTDLAIALEHTFVAPSGNVDTRGIYLSFFAGCSPFSYAPGTIKNEDMSVYFDDQAQAGVDSACDRTIPSVSGRLRTTSVAYPPKNTAFLSAFNGRSAGFGRWDVVFHNYSSTTHTITVDDVCLILNTINEGDSSPREYSLGSSSPSVSGNNILTISDYIDSALFLLDFNHVDNRVADHSSVTPLPDDLSSISDLDLQTSLLEGSAAEYTRIDDAPASSGGNGSMTVADWVQTTRYATGQGFDDPVEALGPLSPYDRVIRAGNKNAPTLIRRGVAEVAVPIFLHTKGVEREIAFGLQFDSNLLEFVRAERGAALPSNAIFQLNNQIGGLPDIIGLQVGLLPGQTFPTTLDGTTPTDFTQNIDADIEIAKFYFRAKTDTGAAATELKFVRNPLIFPAPGVRDPSGALQSTSFVSGEITVINNRDPRPIVRVQDTVINSGGTGIVSVYLDSVGIENSAGFTVNFNPSELTLTKVEKGRDLPTSGFFFTNPDYVLNVSEANTTGKLLVLTGLQPGLSYADGSSNEILRLTFQAGVYPGPAPVTSPITLDVLGDTKEVTDARAVPLVTDFFDGGVRIATGDCAYTLSSTSAAFTPLGTSQSQNQPSFNVISSPSSCPWVATTDSDWITVLTQGIFTGDQTVSYSVAPNTTAAVRVGHIFVAGTTFTITEAGCVYTLNPPSQIFAQDGGDGSFQISTAGSCAWEAVSDSNWIRITSDELGAGIGTITFHVSPLIGDSRTGHIDLVGTGVSFEIIQNRCTYAINPTSSPVISPAGQNGLTVDLTTASDCPWNVSTSDAWIQIQSAPTGVGNTTIIYNVSANPGPQRFGTIQIADRTFQVTQNGTDSCSFAIDVDEVTFSGSGGTGGFNITATEGCVWEAVSNQPWLTITSAGGDVTAPFTGSGNAAINYVVAANAGIARVGNITVGGQTHIVRQFGSNEFTFEFTMDAEGWTFQSVAPTFTAPIGQWSAGTLAEPGRLDLIAQDNTNTFGFWASPSLGLTNASTLDGLYEADFRVSSDAAQAQVPTFRLRTSSSDFSQTDALIITASGNGNLSPGAGGREYNHFFTLPPGATAFRGFFDILNFDPTDAPTGRVSLESITFTPVLASRLTNSTFVRQYTLANDTAGWTVGMAPPYAAPTFTKDSLGLKIGSSFPGPGAPPTTVGFWNLTSNVPLVSNKLYQAAFTVSSHAEGSVTFRKELVPAFRMRINDSSLKLSAFVNVESIDSTARIPTFAEKQTYWVWFQAPVELSGNNILFSFDYLLTPESGNDPRLSLTLESVLLKSYDLTPLTP